MNNATEYIKQTGTHVSGNRKYSTIIFGRMFRIARTVIGFRTQVRAVSIFVAPEEHEMLKTTCREFSDSVRWEDIPSIFLLI